MKRKYSYLWIISLILAILTFPSFASTDNNQQNTIISDQLEIYKSVLFDQTKDESLRIKSAMQIFDDKTEQSTALVIEALKLDKNSQARISVCKAMSRMRQEQKPIPEKDQFITPLIEILKSNNQNEVKYASEALLVYEYNEIAQSLNTLIEDPNAPMNARLNVVNALGIRPDILATIQIIRLVDNPNEQISAEAEKNLRMLSLPIGHDKWDRQVIISELKNKTKDQFLREWLIRQEASVAKLETETIFWKKRYLASLNKLYAAITNEADKGKFLSEYLYDTEKDVKLWALEKVRLEAVGTGSSKNFLELLSQIPDPLIKLIADPDKDIRLRGCELLAIVGEIDAAQALADQFTKETDPLVKNQILKSLGQACSYSSNPNSTVKVAPELKKQALTWAKQYLNDADIAKARIGSDVIRKLLGNSGLTPDEVNEYITLIAKRYNQQKLLTSDGLCKDLLDVMAGLCGYSVYKEKASLEYKPLFEDALTSTEDDVVLAAVKGLINIDKNVALKTLRTDFTKHKSIPVRNRLIELAAETGTADDLNWLEANIDTQDEFAQKSFQAMLEIFKRTDPNTVGTWFDTLDQNRQQGKLVDVQLLSFLEIAEGKISANNIELLTRIRYRMAEIYTTSGNYELAANYYGQILKATEDKTRKNALIAHLLDVYLKNNNTNSAVQVVKNFLLESDINESSPVFITLSAYINNPPAGFDNSMLIAALAELKIAPKRPLWADYLTKWRQSLTIIPDPNKPVQSSK